MILDRVTMTGADDSVDPDQLVQISKCFPFVEWGVLFSGKKQGGPRYPSSTWQNELWKAASQGLQLSAHLCGRWVRDLVLKATPSWWTEHGDFTKAFARVQLNFHGEYHKAALGFVQTLREHPHDYIFQHDGVNDGLISSFTRKDHLKVFPLFDRSGGAGLSPKEWPRPIWHYSGYAGGLGPDNLREELDRILQVARGHRIWIDMETKIRSNDDKMFDLDKVVRCLELVAPLVKHGEA